MPGERDQNSVAAAAWLMPMRARLCWPVLSRGQQKRYRVSYEPP